MKFIKRKPKAKNPKFSYIRTILRLADVAMKSNDELMQKNDKLSKEIEELRIQIESVKQNRNWYKRMYGYYFKRNCELISQLQKLVQENNDIKKRPT